MKLSELLKIKVLYDVEDGNGDGGAGGGETVEVPEYIQSYADSIEDAGQKEYVTGLLKDEKGVNFLKGMVNDPNAEYATKADDFKVINPKEVESFIKEAREAGIPEKYARTALEGRANYLQIQRDLMSAELKALDININNFIASASQEEQDVYARLAENAIGRKILVEKIMSGNAIGSIGSAGAGSTYVQTYDHKSFIDAYNEAKDNNDKEALKRLKQYADKSDDTFYRDFL